MIFSKPKSYLGVDLGAGGIKVVELKQVKKRPMLFTYGYTSDLQNVHQLFVIEKNNNIENLTAERKTQPTVPVIDPTQVKKYADLLKAICVNAKVVSKIASVSLPVSVIFHAVINLPPLKKEEFDKVLRAEIKKLLPRPIEDMVLDYQIVGPNSQAKTQRVLVNAVPKELVMFYTEVFKSAGMVLDSLEPESVALERSLIGRDQSVAMIIDMGAERTNFYIIDQSFAITHHSIEVGGERISKILVNLLGIEEDLVEQLKYDYFDNILRKDGQLKMSKEKFSEIFMPVIDPIVKEIEYSFELYMKQAGNEEKKPEKIILTGGASLMPFLSEHITEKFNIKCYVGDPWGRVVYQDGIKPLLNKIGPRMSVAIGLALRKLV